MTVVVPVPVPLEWPPGDAATLEDFVEDVAGTAYRLAVVSTCLSSSPASAPHWRGADASAAVARVAVVASLADDLGGGVAAAAHRLRAHHDLVVTTRRRIAALRAQQDEDFQVAWRRLSRLEGHAIVDRAILAMTDEPAAVAVVEELEVAESARRREHARLLEELADDAAATARALAAACRSVGGTGHRGDPGQVVAHLAASLPGWGGAELRRLGSDLARSMSGLLSLDERDSLARQAVPYAGSPAFAGSYLSGLGKDGVGRLLMTLGDGDLGPSSALARTLASALGAADPTGTGGDGVREVLAATYVDPDDVSTYPDLVALGMGTVLRAGGAAGPRGETVVRWARQILAREHAQGGGLTGTRAVDRAAPLGEAADPADPLEAVAVRLVRIDDGKFAAALLGERPVWDGLLGRSWDDGGTNLGTLVEHAGTVSGGAGGEAVRSGLEALGAGLDDGDPDDWTVNRMSAAAIAPALGGAVAAHPDTVAAALDRAAGGQAGDRDGDVLRGLGYLTLDEAAARAVEEALRDRVGVLPGSAGPVPPEALVTMSGFVAVREYGQRLAYALHGFEQRAAAEASKSRWDWTWGLLPTLVRRTGAGALAGLTADYAAILLGRDGTWDNGPDRGRSFSAADAEATARTIGLPVADAAAAEATARLAFTRTSDALGRPEPPTSPATDWIEPLADAAGGVVADRAADLVEGRVGTLLEKIPITGNLVGDIAGDLVVEPVADPATGDGGGTPEVARRIPDGPQLTRNGDAGERHNYAE